MHDCQARLSGYHYVAVIDLDEFLVPLTDGNFEKMLVGHIRAALCDLCNSRTKFVTMNPTICIHKKKKKKKNILSTCIA